jgi:hypothetical protein
VQFCGVLRDVIPQQIPSRPVREDIPLISDK